MDDQYVDNLI